MNLAYLAGLIDGEGYIGFTRIKGQLIPRFSITNTNQEIIIELKRKFGGHILKRKPHKIGWKASSHWVMQNKKAIDLLEKVSKYLRIKERQAWCLFLHDAIRPGKGNNWDNNGIEACNLLENQIRWLNKKGDINGIEPMKIACSEARAGKKKKKHAKRK